MRYDFLVFGGTGLQGKICVRDLVESGYSVLIAGRNEESVKDLLKKERVGFIKVNLENEEDIVNAIRKSYAGVVINCAELTFNLSIMNACLKTKKSCTDLGGLQRITSQQFKLDKKFRDAGILNLTGCGSTPGIANVMTRYLVDKLDSVDTIDLGFAWDSNIKKFVIPYSMESIFNEFTEDPVILLNGKFVKSHRGICKGNFKFKEIGEQTCYCIVHSEVFTFKKYFGKTGLKNVHYMAGFPEHSISKIKSLIDLGFNSLDKININGKEQRILDFTNSILKKIKIPKGYKEKENLWVKVYGKVDSKNVEMEMNCIIQTVDGWESAGSNVDTGRTISIMSQMIYNGLIKECGVHSPEAVVPIKPFFKELSKRKMFIFLNNRKIN